MIDCADSTTLRAHLDHADRELDAHLDDCAECTRLLHAVAEDAGYTQQALALLDPDTGADVDVEAALAGALARTVAPVVPLTSVRRREPSSLGRRLVLAGAAAVIVMVATVTPAGRSALAQALDAFRGERLQPVMVDMAEWGGSFGPEDVRALAALGDLDTSRLHEPERVADLAAAEARAGITGPTFHAEPSRLVALAPGQVRLVLDAYEDNGVPARLDGATLIVDVPGAIGAVFGPADGPPEVFVGRSGPLVVRAEGASLDELRAFLLSRDELPAGFRSQLAAIEDWRSTVPIPVPLDGPGWEQVEVAGRQAIAFGDDTGLGSLVVRQDADGVTVVGGRIAVSRALALAAEA
jgi:hypothetical protein